MVSRVMVTLAFGLLTAVLDLARVRDPTHHRRASTVHYNDEPPFTLLSQFYPGGTPPIYLFWTVRGFDCNYKVSALLDRVAIDELAGPRSRSPNPHRSPWHWVQSAQKPPPSRANV